MPSSLRKKRKMEIRTDVCIVGIEVSNVVTLHLYKIVNGEKVYEQPITMCSGDTLQIYGDMIPNERIEAWKEL